MNDPIFAASALACFIGVLLIFAVARTAGATSTSAKELKEINRKLELLLKSRQD